MPETVFNPETIRDAIKLAEDTLDREVLQVDGSGFHRLINWKGEDFKTRLVFSKQPLKDYGGTLGIEDFQNEKGLSLNIEKFQESLKSEKIEEVIHVTGEADLFISEPGTWRDFLNGEGPNPIWEVEKTEEKVISMPCSKLRQV